MEEKVCNCNKIIYCGEWSVKPKNGFPSLIKTWGPSCYIDHICNYDFFFAQRCTFAKINCTLIVNQRGQSAVHQPITVFQLPPVNLWTRWLINTRTYLSVITDPHCSDTTFHSHPLMLICELQGCSNTIKHDVTKLNVKDMISPVSKGTSLYEQVFPLSIKGCCSNNYQAVALAVKKYDSLHLQ